MGTIKRGVSLYSVQHEYAIKKFTLDEIFKALKDMGVEGIELLSDQMIHGAPHPKPETVTMWKNLMDKYGFEPICNDIFINSTLFRNRTLTMREQEEMLKDELRCAHQLGFSQVRLVSNTDCRLIEPVLPLAEELNMRMALEIHAGMSFDGDMTREYTNLMKRLNHPLVGLVLDMGIFNAKHPRIATNYFRQFGLSQPVIDYIDAIFARGSDPTRAFRGENGKEEFPDDLKALIKSSADMDYVIFSSGYENTDFDVLDEYLPYIFSIHGKCYDMSETYEEYSIRYTELFDYLKKKDWSGYIATEYEGNRFVNLDEEVDSLEQVRRHQMMMKKHLGVNT